MKLIRQFKEQARSWIKYPLTYYRQLFDLYRLEENAREVPYPAASSSASPLPFSVILLCQGNCQDLNPFIEAFGEQGLMPSELILLLPDAVSNLDQIRGTLEMDLEFPVHVVTYDPTSLGRARNKGFHKAAQGLVVYTEADCIPRPDWLSSLVNPLQGDPEIDICLALPVPPGLPAWKEVLGNQLDNRMRLTSLHSLQPTIKTFALKKQTWARAGGFPECAPWMTELPLFWMRINKLSLAYTICESELCDCQDKKPVHRYLRGLFSQARGEGRLGIFAPEIWKQLVFLVLAGGFILAGIALAILFPLVWYLGPITALAGMATMLSIWGRKDLPVSEKDRKLNLLDYFKIGWGKLTFLVGYLVGVTGRNQARQKLLDDEKTQLQRIINAHPQVKGVVVYFPTHDWGFMFQRPQQIARHFARQGYLFFYGTKNQTSDTVAVFEDVEQNLFLFSVPPETFQIINRPILYLGSAWFAPLLPLFENPLVIYDHYDTLDISSARLEDHLFLLERADLVLASSQNLIAEAKTFRPEILNIPNAVDYDFVQACKPRDEDSLPDEMVQIREQKKPVIGYVGALAKWFDYGLVLKTAQANPQWEFVLIGSDYDGSVLDSGLLKLSNVNWLGHKPYQDLFSYLWAFDIATIPFKISELTNSVNPVKLFEYFACRKPVVSTPLLECQKYPEVLIAKDVSQFTAQIHQGLDLGKNPEFLSRLDQLARDNTWQERVEKILKQVTDLTTE